MRHTLPVVCMSLLLTACDFTSVDNNIQNTQPPRVDVITLRIQPIVMSATLPGRTVAVRSAEVRPQVDGIIQKRLFIEGTDVGEGQQLYQIDPATYQAAYNKAQATLKNAETLARRYKPLAAAHAVSQQTYDDAVSSALQARADLDTARVNLDYTRVRAPISGRIGRSSYTEGALVTSGQSSYLTTITQLDPIYVDISESSQNLLRLRGALAQGKLKALSDHEAAVQLTLEDGTGYPHEGKLEFSEVTVDQGTGSVTLRATFPNPERSLLPGMFVHALLKQGVQEQGILVPQEAISRDVKGHPYVFVVKNDGTVEQRAITTGEMRDGQWQVLSGLNASEKVVVSNLLKVRAGMKVNAQERIQQSTSDNRNKESLSMTDPSAQ
ncbi:efflux RND transporter periplasmic adaptor subunit [Escherichia coli]|nr:efflux RND transporter periplasmic adaptor subunit [Escherichia coli]